MLKKFKKVLSIACCLFILGGSVSFADLENHNEINDKSVESPIYEFDIQGYTFTYENAPQRIKDEYDKTCRELNITPSPSTEIFIPVDEISKYTDTVPLFEMDKFNVKYFGTRFEVTGAKTYTVGVSTYVGYGHVTSGNPVHLAQLLLKKSGYSIAIDSLFGSSTYSKVRSFQSKYGLSVDGVVGLGTWNKLAQVTNA